METSWRPSLHLTGIPERRYCLNTGEDVKFHIERQLTVIQAETV